MRVLYDGHVYDVIEWNSFTLRLDNGQTVLVEDVDIIEDVEI